MKKTGYLLLGLLGPTVIFMVSFMLYGYELTAIWYPLFLSLLVIALIWVVQVVKENRKTEKIKELLAYPGRNMELNLPVAEDKSEQAYIDVIKSLCTQLAEKEAEYDKKEQETNDYYSTWVHQIKTPIASMGLKLSSMDSKDARVLKQGLRSIESYVDMVMTYERLGSKTTDYVIKSIDLKQTVLSVIKKFSIDFIEKKISLIIDIDDVKVPCDSKWLSVIIEQIISNSLKYTNEGSITVSFDKEKNSLSVADTGIGIDPENLPRIFERGFTGFNGRGESHSSGIGLYITKQIADRLNIAIDCKSVVNEGTEMTLVFPKNHIHLE